MAGTLTPTPFQTVLDTDGVAVSGALIYTYVGGTTTAATTYADASLATANANPIVADAACRFVAYLPAGGNFKFLYKTAAGATIEEQDNILSVPGAAVNLDIEGTVGQAVTAGQVCYLSTGAEATPLTAGLWYLTDADFAPTSTTCQSVGVAVSAIAINTAGTIRLAGTATMATAVVIGSTYYVSATAGAITATPPALSRTVGVALTTSTLLLAATTAVVTPAGSNTQVQFNDSGVLGGDSGFTFIKATDAVAIAGATTVGGTLGVTGLITSTAGISGGPATHTTGSFSSTVATGALTVTGAATVSSTLGVTGAVTGGTYNGQTISSAANFTGTMAVAGAATVSGALRQTGSASFRAEGSGGTAGGSGAGIEIYTAGIQAYNRTTSALAPITIDSTNFLVSAAGLLTVSGFGTHSFSAGGTGNQELSIRNTTAGTGNAALLTLGNNSDANLLNLYAFSSTYTTSGPYVASGVTFRSQGAGGISIAATSASGAIRFYSGGTTERARFETNGYFGLNDTSPGAYLSVSNDPSLVSGFRFSATNSGSGTIGAFRSVTTQVGSITVTGSATAYNTSSDQRLKTDRGLAIDLSGLRALQIHEFVWTKTQITDRGVFAQEALATHPRAVHIGTDEQDDDGVSLKNPWSVDYSKFVPDLIVGWQQHDAIISQLAARIAALETKDH